MASPRIALLFFILALTTVFIWSSASSQSLKCGLKGGALYLVSTESKVGVHDVFTRPVADGGFGYGPWVPSLGLEIRYAPPRGRITLVADFSYTPLHGSGPTNWLDETGDPTLGGRDCRSKLYVVSAGPQWDLISGPVRPYLGGRILWTSMTDVERTAWSGEPFHTQIHGFSRFGLGLVGGATLDLASLLALDICARYNFTSVGNAGEYNAYFNDLAIGVGLLFELL